MTEAATARLVSIPDREIPALNAMQLRRGRMPESRAAKSWRANHSPQQIALNPETPSALSSTGGGKRSLSWASASPRVCVFRSTR